MSDETAIRRLRNLYCETTEFAHHSGKEPIFKITNKSSLAMSEIELPSDKDSFENLVNNLFILFHEASGYSKRLPSDVDEENILQKIKELRNHFGHDREQGTDSEVRKKFAKVGDIYEYLSEKRYPSGNQEWAKAGSCLIQKLITFLEKLKIDLANNKKEKADDWLTEFFEHDFTVFPSKKVKYRICKASEKISSGDSILLLPTFSYGAPAEFGNTQSAIHLTSEAQWADFNGFKDFLREIEHLWIMDKHNDFSPASKLMPWSITDTGEMVYGSGSENLITALDSCYKKIRATVSIVLQGIYGQDNNHTFFIVIGSDIRDGRFTYNFLDFYLSSIPIEWDWINSFNKALDKLSAHNQKASNYVLKQYLYNKWESNDDVELKNSVVAGIGRNGFDTKREWDNFKGLIIKKEDLNVKYSLDEDSWKLSYYRIGCPIKCLDEFTVYVPKVSYEEIQKGEITGIRRPTVFLLGFEGKGWTIYALNIRAWPKLKSE